MAKHGFASLRRGQPEIGKFPKIGKLIGVSLVHAITSRGQIFLEEGAGTLLHRIAQNLIRRPLFHHHTAIHEQDAICHFARKSHLMRDDQHRHMFSGELLHDGIDLVHQLGIECRSRFVEQHHFRLHGERTGNGHTLLLTAGQPRG